MNEQFEKLMYQSGLLADGCWNDMDSYDQGAITKLANLIIKECANRATWAQDTGEADIGGEVLKHFGVEE